MGNSNTVKVVTLPIVISVFGLVCWGQHLECPAQDWTLGSTITLRCYLPREDVPSKCTIFDDEVIFKRRPFSGSPSNRCTVKDVNSTVCTPSSSECGCDTPNATYFIVYHTFPVEDEDNGTWTCFLKACADNFANLVLSFSSANCDNRTVEEPPPTTTPEPTTESTTDTTDSETNLTTSSSNATTAVSTQSPTTTEGKEENTTTSSESPHKYVAAYVGAGFAGLVVIILVVAVVVLRMRSSKKKARTMTNDQATNGTTSARGSTAPRQDTRM